MFQQHLPNFSVAVLLLVAPSNRLADLIPLVPSIIAALPDRGERRCQQSQRCVAARAAIAADTGSSNPKRG